MTTKKHRPQDTKKRTADKTTFKQGLPTKEALREFLHDNPGEVNKREIARAFGINGQDRTALRVLLREMADEGMIERTKGKSFAPKDALPDTALVEIIGLDGDGELRAKPAEWHGRGTAPVIYVLDKRRSEGLLQAGDKVLVRLKRTAKHEYEARILKTLDEGEVKKIIGVFKPVKGGACVYPTDKKIREEYFVPAEFCGDCESGELVAVEIVPPTAKYPRSKNPVRITARLGKKDDPKLISLIAIHSHSIPTEFSQASLKETEQMSEPDLSGGRVDIRHIPLVTIDGADARDFDDAVFAEPDPNPKNEGGWHLIVAIADVSYYVKPFSALDKGAFERGNSTYFADRVVPMLPERLSNDLCSLRPKVNRACLAAHLYLDKNAKLIGHSFFRGLMRSAARLTYEQVEDAHKGYPDDTTGPLLEPVIKPLYKAYALLKKARELRGALELDLPERKAVIDQQGIVTAIIPRVRLESHQLVEEFMILANVAAAEALEAKNSPCVYRVHASPAYERLENTREFLKELGYSLPRGDDLQPRNLNHILKLSKDKNDGAIVHTVILRTQSQAVYSPENIGHFGLALTKYAHFTSPIRRYADLLVHRSLVKSHKLGEGSLTDDEADRLFDIAEHISLTERRSMIAERDAMDRFTAQFLSANVGKNFAGRVSGVTRFGLFVSLDDTGADGIVPMRSLPRDYYIHDEKRHALVGKETGRTFTLSMPVVVKLLEADPMRGSTVFELVTSDEEGFQSPFRSARKGHRDHPRSARPSEDGKRGRRNNGKRGKKKR